MIIEHKHATIWETVSHVTGIRHVRICTPYSEEYWMHKRRFPFLWRARWADIFAGAKFFGSVI